MSQTQVVASGAIRWLRRIIAAICAVLLLFMMGLTVLDVLGRYLMNAPVPGASELTELMLASVIFIGLPAASLDGDHITVDVLATRLRRKIRGVVARLVAGVSAAALGAIAWRLWLIGDQIGGYGGTTPTLKLPIAPVAYLVAVLCAAAAAVTAATVLERRVGHV